MPSDKVVEVASSQEETTASTNEKKGKYYLNVNEDHNMIIFIQSHLNKNYYKLHSLAIIIQINKIIITYIILLKYI